MSNRMGPEVRGTTTRPPPIPPSSVDTWFQDCVGGDPTTGTAFEQGWFNGLLAKFRDLFNTVNGPAVSDDHMLTAGIALQSQQNKMRFSYDSGSVNNLKITLDPVPTVLTDGMEVVVAPIYANTGACTLTINTTSGLVTKPLVRQDGDALRPNDIRVLSRQLFVLDLAVNVWRVATWVPSQGLKLNNVTGTGYTYSGQDVSQITNRSNSGGAMSDVLPGPGVIGVLPSQSMIQIRNNDSQGILAVQAGAGATILGELNGWVYIGPSQSVTFISDGANYSVIAKPGRCRLTAGLNLFAGGGSDTVGSGLFVGSSWATPQHAWDVIAALFDLNGYQVVVNVAHGYYAGSGGNPVLNASGPVAGQKYPSSIVFSGDPVTPSNVIWENTAAGGYVVEAQSSAQVMVQGIQIKELNGWGLYAAGSGTQLLYGHINFDACLYAHVVTNTEAFCQMFADCTILGASGMHWDIQNNSTFAPTYGTRITISGSPNFSNSFVSAANGTWSAFGTAPVTFVGGATGYKFVAALGGVIDTQGAGVSYFPGTIAGYTASGGQYN